jgi:selenium metabolism protein YedF
MKERDAAKPVTVDARGMACPQPVVLTKKALEKADSVTVLVDNETAAQNVSRLAKNQGCQISFEQRGDCTVLHLSGKTGRDRDSSERTAKKTVLLVGSSTLGRGEEELGHVLMRSFMHTLGETEAPPQEVIFINSGVKLVSEGSEVLDDLRELEKRGLDILACGTCLGYYKLKDAVKVGRISNMYDITSALLEADRVISL